MTIAKHLQQNRRFSAVLRRAVANKRLVVVGVFLVVASLLLRRYDPSEDEDRTFLSRIVGSFGHGDRISQGGEWSVGGRVGRGMFLVISVPGTLYFCNSYIHVPGRGQSDPVDFEIHEILQMKMG